MVKGPDQGGGDPDMQVSGWETISLGASVTIDKADFKSLRILEIADVHGNMIAYVSRNLQSNKKEEKTATFMYSTGEKMLLLIPGSSHDVEKYVFFDPNFELKLYGDGSVILVSDTMEPGISCKMVDLNLNVAEPGCNSVPDGADDYEFDGRMIGNRSVAGSTHRELGVSKYSLRNEDKIGHNFDTVIVADGMGSTYAPEHAAKFVVDAFLHQKEDLESVFNLARNVFIYWFSHYLKKKKLQSDTVLAVARLKEGNRLDLLSIGDARWRLVRAGKVILASHDDSKVQMMQDVGIINEREKCNHPERNVVMSSLLCGDPLIVSNVQTQPGDVLVLYSDGMDSITDEELAEIVTKFSPSEAVKEANKLVAERNSHIDKNAFFPQYLRDFKDGEPPMLVDSPMDNGTIAIVAL